MSRTKVLISVDAVGATTHLQPKLRPATTGWYLTWGNALSAAFLARLGRLVPNGGAAANIASTCRSDAS
jgi:hypothetical protein